MNRNFVQSYLYHTNRHNRQLLDSNTIHKIVQKCIWYLVQFSYVWQWAQQRWEKVQIHTGRTQFTMYIIMQPKWYGVNENGFAINENVLLIPAVRYLIGWEINFLKWNCFEIHENNLKRKKQIADMLNKLKKKKWCYYTRMSSQLFHFHAEIETKFFPKHVPMANKRTLVVDSIFVPLHLMPFWMVSVKINSIEKQK